MGSRRLAPIYASLPFLLVACGCALFREPAGLPKDPLLQISKPVERKPGQAIDEQFAFAHPSAPAAPDMAALARAYRLPVDEKDFPANRPQFEATPVSRPGRPEPLQGHAPDFSWIIGVLEIQPDGVRLIRFDRSAPADLASVILAPTDLFASFGSGDVLFVEGALGDPLKMEIASPAYRPYRARTVKKLFSASNSG